MNEERSEERELLQQGETLLQSGRYAQAADYADRVLEMDAMNVRAYLLKGAASAYGDDLKSAKECFKRALLIDKKSGEAHYHLGSVCLLEGEIDRGIEEYQSALENDYDYPEVYFNLGLAYEERKDYETAIHEYTRAIRKDSLNPLFYIRKGQVYMAQARYQEALKIWEELRKKCPDSFEGYHYAAQIYTIQGELDRADDLLRSAEEEFTEDMDLLLDRLRILVAKGDMETALKEVEKARSMAGTVAQQKEVALNEAKLYGIKGDMEQCTCVLEHALTMGADERLDAETHYLLITAYQTIKEYEKMELHAKALGELDVNNPYALGAKFFSAYASVALGRADRQQAYKEAVRYYRGMALEHPERVESYVYRAVCHKESGEPEKALEMIDYVMLLHTSGKLWMIKAGILKDMNRTDEAREALQKAKEAGEEIPGWEGEMDGNGSEV